jgi:hypothetical protein
MYNYAAVLFDLKRSQEMLPVVSKLLQLDPSNPDNVLLYAYAYKGLSDATSDAAQKKAFTDSAIAYSSKSDLMKHKVEFKNLDRGKDATTLDVEIENKDKAAKSYTVEFEFLDKTGTVIAKGGVAGVRYAPIP